MLLNFIGRYVRYEAILHSWALLYRVTFTPVLFVKVSKHAGTSKYRDESIGALSSCFLQITTVPLQRMKYYSMPSIY